MGLSSLIKVAQGKNAANVSFEDSFLKGYEAAVIKYEEENKQPIPKDYFRPSSMYGCERMLYFMRTEEEQDKEEHDTNLMEICHSGTDRHLRIQHLVESMEGVKTLDLEEMVKEAQAKGINTEFVGWNEDHTEARCKNDDLSIWFQPDGVLNFMGKDVILEIKTESTYQHSKRYEPKMDHKYQATCYGLGLGIDYILFFYEDRNFCNKKPYLWKITDEMKEEVRSKIQRVNNYLAHREAPPANKDKCTYCRYKEACKRLERAQEPDRNIQDDKEVGGAF